MNFLKYFLFLGSANSLTAIPERAAVDYANDKYVANAKFYVSRHGRKSPYYLNIEGTTKHMWQNNVTVNMVSYEYLHNEYRRSFAELHLMLCDLLNLDPYVGKMLTAVGAKCPLPQGDYHFFNMTVPVKDFSQLWPFVKAKIEIEVVITDTKERMSLTIVPERAGVDYVSDKYVANAKFYISRHGRKSPYYINIEGTIKHTWQNNVTVNLLYYEYLHNEYRRSFVEMHFKLCDLLALDPYVGKMLKAVGAECPLKPNDYHFLNMTVPAKDFSQLWPFEKAKVEVEIVVTDTKERMAQGYIMLQYKNILKNRKEKNT